MGNAQKKTEDNDSFLDELKPGTELLQGQYVIEKFLNSGGFGITYLAKDSLDRRVVIKECFPSSFCQRSRSIVQARSRAHTTELASVVNLFVQEARSLAKLDHPNIVGVHQVFEDNQTAYMVLDFVEGRDLLDTLEDEDHGLQPEQIKGILKDVLGAVKFIHNQDILHRDISPDNILIDGDLRPVLIDFGAAREEATKQSRVLSALRVVKDGYSPQEFYIQGSEQNASSDLYALGATFYHLITGDIPANSQSRLAAIASGEPDPYVPIADTAKGYDRKFLEAMDKALGILPKDRLQSAQDWLDMMEGGRRKTTIITPMQPPSSAAAAMEAAQKKPSKLVVLLGSAAVLAIVAVGGLFATGALNGGDNVATISEEEAKALEQEAAVAKAEADRLATETEAARAAEVAAAEAEANRLADLAAAAEAEAARQAELAAAEAEAARAAELAAAEKEAALEAEIAAAEAEAQRLAQIAAEAEATRQAEIEAKEAEIAAAEAEAQRLTELAAEADAEAQRQAELAAQTEAQRQAEIAAKEAEIAAAEAEAQRQATLAAEAEAARQAEIAAAQAEAERLAEEQRQAEIAAAEAERIAAREAQIAAEEARREAARLAEIAAAEAEAQRLTEIAAAEAAEVAKLGARIPRPRSEQAAAAFLQTQQPPAVLSTVPAALTVTTAEVPQPLTPVRLSAFELQNPRGASALDTPTRDTGVAVDITVPEKPLVNEFLASVGTIETTDVLSAWSVELPFGGQSGSNVIARVADVAPVWAREGARVTAVNGTTISQISDINQVLRASVDPADKTSQQVTLTVAPADGAPATDVSWEFPVVQETILLNGLEFRTHHNGDSWTTIVTSAPAQSDLQEGDALVALMSTSEQLNERTSLINVLNRELGNGSNEFSFAVSREGSMWIASMTYLGGA